MRPPVTIILSSEEFHANSRPKESVSMKLWVSEMFVRAKHTKGIWKVLSTVFYLSSQFTWYQFIELSFLHVMAQIS